MQPVVVLAGGLGTRVAHLAAPEQPKALLPLDGHAFIDYELASLAAAGATQVVVLAGYGADQLRAHVGDERRFGLSVSLVEDGPVLLGTGGAIRAVVDRLPSIFWVTYGDTLLQVPVDAVEARLAQDPTLLGIMTVLANNDRWETSNVDVDGDLVAAYEKHSIAGTHRHIDYGMLLFRREVFEESPVGRPSDLSEVVRGLVARRALGAFEVTERFHDIGTEAAWRETERWCRQTRIWDALQIELEARGRSDGQSRRER
jgi:NDP-sugar pyrophosphorylase family protein